MSVRLRYLFFFLVAASPLAIVRDVKAAPMLLLGGLFVLHAAVSLALRGRERSTGRDVLSAALLALSLLVGSAFLLVSLALVLAPPVTHDGHPVMAIGQVYVGNAGGVLAGGLLTFAALRRRWRDLTFERMVLHVLGASVVAAAIVRVVRDG